MCDYRRKMNCVRCVNCACLRSVDMCVVLCCMCHVPDSSRDRRVYVTLADRVRPDMCVVLCCICCVLKSSRERWIYMTLTDRASPGKPRQADLHDLRKTVFVLAI